MTMQEETYFKEIEKHILKIRGRGLLLGGSDYVIMEKWEKLGIPVEIVKKGIDASIDGIRFNKRGNVSGIISLSSCSGNVLKMWRDRKESFAGKNREEAAPRKLITDMKINEVESMAVKLESAGLDKLLPSAGSVVGKTYNELLSLSADIKEKRVTDADEAYGKAEAIREEFYKNIRLRLSGKQVDELLLNKKEMLWNLKKSLNHLEYKRTEEELLSMALAEMVGI